MWSSISSIVGSRSEMPASETAIPSPPSITSPNTLGAPEQRKHALGHTPKRNTHTCAQNYKQKKLKSPAAKSRQQNQKRIKVQATSTYQHIASAEVHARRQRASHHRQCQKSLAHGGWQERGTKNRKRRHMDTTHAASAMKKQSNSDISNSTRQLGRNVCEIQSNKSQIRTSSCDTFTIVGSITRTNG